MKKERKVREVKYIAQMFEISFGFKTYTSKTLNV